jgi:hypothetical protein
VALTDNDWSPDSHDADVGSRSLTLQAEATGGEALPGYYGAALEAVKAAGRELGFSELQVAVFPDRAYRGSLMGAVVRHLQRLGLLERRQDLAAAVTELGRETELGARVVDLA